MTGGAMNHDAIEAQLIIRLLKLADSMDADRYPDADLVRSAAHRIEHLTALLHAKLRVELDMGPVTVAHELIASERNAYKERAETADDQVTDEDWPKIVEFDT